MFRALFITAFIGLAACAASPSEEPGPDPALAFALGADLSCNSRQMRKCPPGGCAPGEAGEAMEIPISVRVPERGGVGRFCIATGCEEAHFTPTLTRAPGWTARMATNDRTSHNSYLEISRDLRTFTLSNADSDGIDTWTGECRPAAPLEPE